MSYCIEYASKTHPNELDSLNMTSESHFEVQVTIKKYFYWRWFERVDSILVMNNNCIDVFNFVLLLTTRYSVCKRSAQN